MARAPAKSIPMACLTIGHCDYLMAAAKAIKVAELMQDAFNCVRSYGDHDFVYEVQPEQPRVSFSLVRPSQVRMPDAEPTLQPARPRLLK